MQCASRAGLLFCAQIVFGGGPRLRSDGRSRLMKVILSTAPPDLDKICESVCPRLGISKNLSTAPQDLDKNCESVCPRLGISKNLSTAPPDLDKNCESVCSRLGITKILSTAPLIWTKCPAALWPKHSYTDRLAEREHDDHMT